MVFRELSIQGEHTNASSARLTMSQSLKPRLRTMAIILLSSSWTRPNNMSFMRQIWPLFLTQFEEMVFVRKKAFNLL